MRHECVSDARDEWVLLTRVLTSHSSSHPPVTSTSWRSSAAVTTFRRSSSCGPRHLCVWSYVSTRRPKWCLSRSQIDGTWFFMKSWWIRGHCEISLDRSRCSAAMDAFLRRRWVSIEPTLCKWFSLWRVCRHRYRTYFPILDNDWSNLAHHQPSVGS